MTFTTTSQIQAVDTSRPMEPYWAEIMEIKNEAPGIATYWLRFKDPALRAGYSFKPGQFNMIFVPGYGEVAISISSDPGNNELIGHTVRAAGSVTNKITRMKVGDVVGLRGPFGTSWPLEQCKGSDVLISTGGIGLPLSAPRFTRLCATGRILGALFCSTERAHPQTCSSPANLRPGKKPASK